MIRTVADILDVEDFYELRHQHIYKAMLELDENKCHDFKCWCDKERSQ